MNVKGFYLLLYSITLRTLLLPILSVNQTTDQYSALSFYMLGAKYSIMALLR